MKKSYSFLLLLSILTSCSNPESRNWIIPVTIDPADFTYTPVQKESFAIRRNKLISLMEEGFAVIGSGGEEQLNRHGFRPNNYFYYLTGCDLPGSYALISGKAPHPFILATPPRSIRRMIYSGNQLSEKQAREQYAPDTIISRAELLAMVDSILDSGVPVYLDMNDRELLEELGHRPGSPREANLESLAGLVDGMRVVKGSMEVERIQKACNITSKALIHAMKECAPEMHEFEIESVIEGTFLQYGAAMPGFPSIVGSGPNSTILHYDTNRRKMMNGDLLLMDIGAEYGYYCADITRTIPVNGRFTEEQRTIYELVLEAQKAAIEELLPGNRIGDGHDAAARIIREGLFSLGLITDSTAGWQSDFYVVHPSSHYLGLDVHDVGDYGGFFEGFHRGQPGDLRESRELVAGMVLTIEPGLYFRQNGLQQLYEIFGHRVDSAEIAAFIEAVSPVYEKYLNMGVRIEDDVLITEEGHINLSRYAPKEVRDIEQLMR